MNHWKEIEGLLALVEKPARYIGGEEGSILKEHDDKLLFALAFPEVYEIGASHFGGQIIYNIANKEPDIACERVYMPWNDMRILLRERRIPLVTLESKTPLADFHVLGFTLENELSCTNILEMLDLSAIPLRARERSENMPLVIGGGVGAFHPEMLADFFDAFFVGDAEAGFIDVLKHIKSARDAGVDRKNILSKIAQFPGVYVPSLYNARFDDGRFTRFIATDDAPNPVKAATVPELKDEFYPIPPIVPWIEVVHHRLRAEISRGCGCGCRFCDAGFIYRPVRERTTQSIMNELKENYAKTGWEEMSVVSLSSTEYTTIVQLLEQMHGFGKNRHIKFSFPSLNIHRFGVGALDVLGMSRKSGLTFAPEAGTERLRAVINKTLDEEKLFYMMEEAFKRKWRKLKLYFMVGLPTETDEDIEGIVRMLARAGTIARKYNANIRVTISPFVPKPHTPFQWERQCDVDEILQKEMKIQKSAPKRVEISIREPKLSVLEGALSRGDRRFGKAILRAWQMGAMYASWSEFHNMELFADALGQEGIDLHECCRERNIDEPVPWNVIDKGIDIEFLRAERERAYAQKITHPCRTRRCEKCKYCDLPPQVILPVPDSEKRENARVEGEIQYGRHARRTKTDTAKKASNIVRIKYSRRGKTRFIGHLDTLEIWEHALRKSGFPFLFTEGYNIRPRMSFSPPLPIGCESEAEYIDIFMNEVLQPDRVSKLAAALPCDFEMTTCMNLSGKPNPLQTAVRAALWLCRMDISTDKLDSELNRIERCDSIRYQRYKREVDIRPLLMRWKIARDGDSSIITMLLRAGDAGNGRPSEFFKVAGFSEFAIAAGKYVRQEMLIQIQQKWITPMGKIFELPFFGES